MKARQLHRWDLPPREAIEVQRRLAATVVRQDRLGVPRLVAGVDTSGEKGGLARAAVVVLSFPGLELVEVRTAEGPPPFPYVPGLLSFREAPLVVAACAKLVREPDVLVVDGHGVAHPRRLGIASHLGLLFDAPAVGCAKSLLCGSHGPLGEDGLAEVVDGGEVVGMAVRTRAGVRPVYVSIGHKVDLPAAVSLIKACCRGYRLPEPTRLAHMAAGGAELEPGRALAPAEARWGQAGLDYPAGGKV